MGQFFSHQGGDATAGSKWHLDVVGILAILGEANIRLNALLITSTGVAYIPRLIPAPQALLSGKRMKRLPRQEEVKVNGVFSGNKSQLGLSYFATLLHENYLDDPPFLVRNMRITLPKETIPGVRRRPWAPLNVIAVASGYLSLSLLLFAFYLKDGIGFIAVFAMSLNTSLLCLAAHWAPRLPMRKHPPRPPSHIPRGDVVIQTVQGSFVVVHCEDDVARSLYFAPEDCQYTLSSKHGRALGGFAGGIIIMVCVVLFSNCTWQLQIAVAVSYGILNAVYWFATVLPTRWTWDLTDFRLEPSADGVKVKEPKVQRGTFTGALAAAIRFANSTKWVLESEAAPTNEAWRNWLDLAETKWDDEEWWIDRLEVDPNLPLDQSNFQSALTYFLKEFNEGRLQGV